MFWLWCAAAWEIAAEIFALNEARQREWDERHERSERAREAALTRHRGARPTGGKLPPVPLFDTKEYAR